MNYQVLYVVKNVKEKFTILVVASNHQEAVEIAKEYFIDSHMNHKELSVCDFSDINIQFDCDYVVARGQ